jgi:hypothetical protein
MPPPVTSPADTRRRENAERNGEPERMRRVVDVAELCAATRTHRARRRINLYPALRRQVDHQAAVHRPHPGAAVAGAARCDLEPELSRLAHCAHHVRRVDATGDRRRSLVDHRVVDLARVVVPRIVRADHVPAQSAGQLLDRAD